MGWGPYARGERPSTNLSAGLISGQAATHYGPEKLWDEVDAPRRQARPKQKSCDLVGCTALFAAVRVDLNIDWRNLCAAFRIRPLCFRLKPCHPQMRIIGHVRPDIINMLRALARSNLKIELSVATQRG